MLLLIFRFSVYLSSCNRGFTACHDSSLICWDHNPSHSQGERKNTQTASQGKQKRTLTNANKHICSSSIFRLINPPIGMVAVCQSPSQVVLKTVKTLLYHKNRPCLVVLTFVQSEFRAVVANCDCHFNKSARVAAPNKIPILCKRTPFIPPPRAISSFPSLALDSTTPPPRPPLSARDQCCPTTSQYFQ